MSATAQNYVYRVRIDKNKKAEEKVITREQLKQYREESRKLFTIDENKNRKTK